MRVLPLVLRLLAAIPFPINPFPPAPQPFIPPAPGPGPGPAPTPPAPAPSPMDNPWFKWGFWALRAIFWLFIGMRFGCAPPPLPIEPVYAGWVAMPEETAAIVQELRHQTFAETPAYRAWLQSTDDGDVYLWDAARKVLGDVLPARNQSSIGSCVSFGTGSAIEHLMLVQIAQQIKVRGPPQEFKPLCQEAIYGLSRVQIGGGKIRGDGSVGAWAAKAVKDYGVLPREKVGSYDLSSYSVERCRDWGNRGLPRDLEDLAKKYPVKAFTTVTTTDQAIAALRNGYPIACCSNQGFASTRDKDGFARAQGSWAHCMCILGYRADKGGFFIWNSWGPDWIKGPEGPGNPPKGGFWAEKSVVNRMLSGGDSFAFSDATGFPARAIDWFVRRALPPEETFYALLQNPGRN